VRWLLVSVALSVVLTVILNVGLRAFPEVGRRIAHRLSQLGSPSSDGDADARDRRVQVYVPWRGMIIASLILTLLVNLLL
jgi:Protein of unknown function (DUF2905)